MDGKTFVSFVKTRFNVHRSSEVAKVLDFTPARITQIESQEKIGKSLLTRLADAERKKATADLAEDLFESMAANSSFKKVTQKLGTTYTTLHNWKKYGVTSSKLRRMFHSVYEAGQQAACENAIFPLCEFVPIDPGNTIKAAKSQVLCRKTATTYYKGLIEVLKGEQGVYTFYNSSGEAIYVGKTQERNIWDEMNDAYSRDRPTQRIHRVKHVVVNKNWSVDDGGTRKIIKTNLPLFEMAYYFSAYRVSAPMIPQIEALLIRAFANDILNDRMETFRFNGS